MTTACYRELHRYKYQLVEDYVGPVGLTGVEAEPNPYLRLTAGGELTIRAGYAWDGPSGPTIDTRSFMRGSLVHDALYQLIRLRALEPVHREHADRLLRALCRQDGMSAVRAFYVYWSVRLFGAAAARPGTDVADSRVCVP